MSGWALDTNADALRGVFYRFLSEFQLDTPSGAVRVYVRAVNQMIERNSNCLQINLQHLQDFQGSAGLAQLVVTRFAYYEPLIVEAVRDLIRSPEINQDEWLVTMQGGYHRERHLTISMTNPDTVRSVAELSASHVGSLFGITGTVVRGSEVLPELVLGSFRCMSCGETLVDVPQQFKYTEPPFCPRCGASSSTQNKNFELLMERSVFTDFQRLRVQGGVLNRPDETQGAPAAIEVVCRGSLCNLAHPGDNILVTGTLLVLPDISVMDITNVGKAVNKDVAAGFSLQSDARQNQLSSGLPRGREEGVAGLAGLAVREIRYRLAFAASSLQVLNSVSDFKPEGGISQQRDRPGVLSLPQLHISPGDSELVHRMTQDPDLVDSIVSSFAPHIFGHEDIKLGIILQFLGGVEKEGRVSIRRDINVLLVGDPSTAKSMLLKYAAEFHPKAVYTSGKSSSAAGLTAAVVMDPETKDFAIEAGALLRADGGICCIDELEKMSQMDQVALHECLEQGTISISKAGINVTLKAKTPVLAAMNPVGSRYNRMRSLRQNISISQAILSRFDLCFVLLDEPKEDTDKLIARRIIAVQQHGGTPVGGGSGQAGQEGHGGQESQAGIRGSRRSSAAAGGNLDADAATDSTAPVYSLSQLRTYLLYARQLRPVLTSGAMEEISKRWGELRVADMSASSRSFRVTVRQLESLIRLSEAFAKLCIHAEVMKEHVERAASLLATTCVTIAREGIRFTVPAGAVSAISAVSAMAEGGQGPAAHTQAGGDDGQSDSEAGGASESSSRVQMTVAYEEIVRLSYILRFAAQTNPDGCITQQAAVASLMLNLSVPNKGSLTEAELRNACVLILRKMVWEYLWFQAASDHEYGSDELLLRATALAPELM